MSAEYASKIISFLRAHHFGCHIGSMKLFNGLTGPAVIIHMPSGPVDGNEYSMVPVTTVRDAALAIGY